MFPSCFLRTLNCALNCAGVAFGSLPPLRAASALTVTPRKSLQVLRSRVSLVRGALAFCSITGRHQKGLRWRRAFWLLDGFGSQARGVGLRAYFATVSLLLCPP